MPLYARTVIFGILFCASNIFQAMQAVGQEPNVLHAQLSTQSTGKGLTAKLDARSQMDGPSWVGYPVAVAKSFHTGSDPNQITYLEGSQKENSYGGRSAASFDHLVVLMRVVAGKVEDLRIVDPDQQLDAGGLPFVWLTGVTAVDSIHVLQSIALASNPQKLRNDAVFLISLHDSSKATEALSQLASSGNDLDTREKAAFWLANQRGRDGFLAIQRLAHDDPDSKFREKLTFDLTLSKEPAALDELVRMAHSDASPQVRRQAQFWMATTGGKRVAADLRSAAERDPNTEVRKSAVFALSRLPADEAATQLIQVAQTSKDGEVRRQAVFWLGQSSDPRALEYLTALVTNGDSH